MSCSRVLATALLTTAALAAGACGPRDPTTDAERLARGRQIVEGVSATLGSASALSVNTREVRDRRKADGTTERVQLVRQTIVRRPDRLYFRTTGDVDNEGWYDGVGLTIALHGEKVFAQARMPETLDGALDALHERYAVPLPLADYLYSSPANALLADSTTGGWAGRETIDGQQTDHLAFKDRGVEWELWVSTAADPLPVKAVIRFPGNERLQQAELSFADWNFSPAIAADRFTPRIGADYEGIAILQRESILRHVPEDDAAAPDASKKK